MANGQSETQRQIEQKRAQDRAETNRLAAEKATERVEKATEEWK
jgi:hypothetical protein